MDVHGSLKINSIIIYQSAVIAGTLDVVGATGIDGDFNSCRRC